MHLTMKFLGDVPDQHVPEVCDTCEHVAGACEPFDLMVDRCGCFPRNGRVRVIWCGSTDGSSAATVCASRLEDAFAELGFERESRPFSPHMTLGRVRDDRTRGRLRDAVEHIQPGTATQRVDELTVFQSILSSQGPRYTALGRFRLGGQR